MGNIPFSAFCCFRAGALNFPEGVGTGILKSSRHPSVLTSDKMAVSTFVRMFIAE